jgi:protein lifeguard
VLTVATVWWSGCRSHHSNPDAVYSQGLFDFVSINPHRREYNDLLLILSSCLRTVQLLLTTVLSGISFFNTSYKTWIQNNVWLMTVSLIGAIVFMLLTFWKRKSYPANLLFLSTVTALEAYAISVVTSFYDSRVVLQALIITLGIFVGLTLFACQTKYDFTSWYPYLFGGLWLLIIFGFVAYFIPRNDTIELVYGGVAALIFSGYILVDTQLIMRHYHVEEEIAAAISLYLDILNLFLAILRILNSQSNN